VILSDVTMPEMDGWQLLRLIRSRPHLAQIPVIFLTRLTSDGERLLGYRLGVDDYVGKPFTGAELGARVRRIIERTRAQGGAPANKALRGDLSQVALPSMLSLVEMERRTGVLTLVCDDELATLYLRDGAVVRIDLSARHAHKQGIDRFFHVLGWTRGQFELAASEVTADDQIELKTSYVLLEHARRRDEGTL
jgi:DNA-binding response OmpR family regulator